LPGILSVNLINGEVNNKNDKNNISIVAVCGEQIKEFKSKAELGKNPEWKENFEFKITVEPTLFFIVYSQEKNTIKTLGITGQSLYHVSHGKETEKNTIRLLEKDIDVGCVNFELKFQGL